MIKLGNIEIYPIVYGFFRLDGGAMFGVVPKVLWEKTNPPDENNRIILALRSALLKTQEGLVLIDTGIGNKGTEKFNHIYHVEAPKSPDEVLKDLGFMPDEVKMVINTHLHFDHCGGNTRYNESGRVVPTFPNAQYYIQNDEWNAAENPDRRSRASYLKENFVPLKEHNQVVLLDGDTQIAPGIKVIKTAGHTFGHQIVIVTSENKTFVYWGDLIPTSSHLSLPYIMSYDLFPLQTMDHKERLLKQAVKENWVSFFEHDPKIAMAYLKEENSKVQIAEIVE
ncbi:MAG: MBL fold metallo-hydrolase [candidate division WOR-3 bacterium]|nr:MBL fold metallo-hydrolase [candidate division WOR-3 bacterium]